MIVLIWDYRRKVMNTNTRYFWVSLSDRLLSWLYIRRMYGSRCPDYSVECFCCEAWYEHDELFS